MVHEGHILEVPRGVRRSRVGTHRVPGIGTYQGFIAIRPSPAAQRVCSISPHSAESSRVTSEIMLFIQMRIGGQCASALALPITTPKRHSIYRCNTVKIEAYEKAT